MSSATRLKALLAQRIVVIDGATGTLIQARKLQEADYRGDRFKDNAKDLKGNSDILNLTRRDVIEDIQRAYLEGRGRHRRDQHLHRPTRLGARALTGRIRLP